MGGDRILRQHHAMAAAQPAAPAHPCKNACMSKNSPTTCPCDPGRPYADCCGRYHAGAAAPDAASLMRSRYSAYVLQRTDYLLASWHPETRPVELSLDDVPGQRTQWLGLTVHSHREEGDKADVRFTARYRIGGGSAVKMTEHSRFQRIGGQWFYLDALGASPPRDTALTAAARS